MSELPKLTQRQAEFLSLAAMGMNRIMIAEECCVSQWTVHNTLESAKERLGARSLPQAVARAIAYRQILLGPDGFVIAA